MSTLDRYRPTVTAPDGRTFRGRWPHQLGIDGEALYIAALAKTVRGVCEVTLPAGRADVATGTDVYEVEPAKSWRVGARQAFSYAGMTGLRPALALFGPADWEWLYLRIRDRMKPLTLWRWWAPGWQPVDSHRLAKLADPANRLRNTCPACLHRVRPAKVYADRLGYIGVYDHCGTTWTHDHGGD